MMAHRHMYLANCHASRRMAMRDSYPPQCHFSEAAYEEIIPLQWYDKTFPKLTKMACQLQNVGRLHGRLVDIQSDSIIADDHLEHEMRTFKSLARLFVSHPSIQQKLRDRFCAASPSRSTPAAPPPPPPPFGRSSERQEMILSSLTRISSFLNVSSQNRKAVRRAVSEQVTQHRIWVGALREILSGLESELESVHGGRSCSPSSMGIQIIARCADLLRDPESPPWVKLHRANPSGKSSLCSSSKWEDLLEMLNDLFSFLKSERALCNLEKLMAMKEGLTYIKDVSIDTSGIATYRGVRLRGCLVQRKLSVALGYSSRCLFTLLLYYLFGCVSDIEVDLCGGLSPRDGHRSTLYMGSILSSGEEPMLRTAIKQLHRALELFKFVWESAGMNGALILEGHLWCVVGDEDKVINYRGNSFFIHQINI